MAKASITFTNGTQVHMEGSPEEIHELLAFYSDKQSATTFKNGNLTHPKQAKKKSKERQKPSEKPAGIDLATIDLTAIINSIKNCDASEKIEENILDRTSEVDRTLLPIYIVYKYFENKYDLSSGEIAKITKELGVPVSQPHTSRALSGTAAKYVVGNKMRKKGHQVRYKLARRGLQYMEKVISGVTDEEQS